MKFLAPDQSECYGAHVDKVRILIAIAILGMVSLSVTGIAWGDSRLLNASNAAGSSPSTYTGSSASSGPAGFIASDSLAVQIDGILVEYRTANAYGQHLEPYWHAQKQRVSSGEIQDITNSTGDNLPSLHDTDFRLALDEAIRGGEAMVIDLTSTQISVGDTTELPLPDLTRISRPFAREVHPEFAREAAMERDIPRIAVSAKVRENNTILLNVVSPQFSMASGETVASRIGYPLNYQKNVENGKSEMFYMGFVRRVDPGHLSIAMLYLSPRLVAAR